MSQDFGNAVPPAHRDKMHSRPARYMVLIDTGSGVVAQLFLEDHEQVAEFDGGAEEVALMIQGLAPAHSARDAAWDHAFQGRTPQQREGARVYTLGT